jgi:hypothetical protein
MAACADAANEVGESDESNNCSFSQLGTVTSTIVPIEPSNQPPLCDLASATTTVLWPPSHKMVSVGIQGVTDPEGRPITIRIDSVQQDEPVNGLGDGDTAPDAVDLGSSTVKLRAERAGTGNGRVYLLDFSASDMQGGSCSGRVQVGVPHDKGRGPGAIDDGLRYASGG